MLLCGKEFHWFLRKIYTNPYQILCASVVYHAIFEAQKDPKRINFKNNIKYRCKNRLDALEFIFSNWLEYFIDLGMLNINPNLVRSLLRKENLSRGEILEVFKSYQNDEESVIDGAA